jgi:hypothetical protein
MARSATEIHADITLTRREIEEQLDAFSRRVSHTRWAPWLAIAGALGVGLLLSQVPLLRVVGLGARTVQAGIGVAGALTAVDRFLAARRGLEA